MGRGGGGKKGFKVENGMEGPGPRPLRARAGVCVGGTHTHTVHPPTHPPTATDLPAPRLQPLLDLRPPQPPGPLFPTAAAAASAPTTARRRLRPGGYVHVRPQGGRARRRVAPGLADEGQDGVTVGGDGEERGFFLLCEG